MIKFWLLPLLLAVGLAACDSGGVNPGYVNTAAANGNAGGAASGGSGRVVAINDVSMRGSNGGGSGGRGPLIGGVVGGLGGAAIGAGTTRTLGGGLIGGLLGAVGGAIAGSIFDSHGSGLSGGRGIEVTVERDDGQQVRVAQRDDGDIQLGDRVQIVQNGRGAAKVVRDTSRTFDRTAGNGPPPQYNGPPPSNDPSQYSGPYNKQFGPRDSGPPPDQQDYRQSQGNYPQPQDDPRYGTLNN